MPDQDTATGSLLHAEGTSPRHVEAEPPARTGGSPPPERILCVDDDPNILDGLRRQLRRKFRLQTAVGPEQGLGVVEADGPFAVVVSDLHMPGMNGIQFLSEVRARSPRSVRIMLTGQADLSSAMAAVNQGNIFRFLVKPCSPIVFSKVLDSALHQYRLAVAEKQLTEETLLSCVEVLVEILSIVQPEAFGRATRLRRYVRHVAEALNGTSGWELETAALLSQIGWITIPPVLAHKVASGEALTPAERGGFRAHAAAGGRLLEKIPRLGPVADAIANQFSVAEDHLEQDSPETMVTSNAQILCAAIAVDELQQEGLPENEILIRLKERSPLYRGPMLQALAELVTHEQAGELRLLPISEMRPGMTLDEDVDAANGLCLVRRGQELTTMSVQRLQSFSHLDTLNHTYRVRVRAANSTGHLREP